MSVITKLEKTDITEGLNTGDTAPDFALPIDSGGKLKLSEFRGKKNIALYFYPKDDTPGCTLEAKDFRDLKAEFEKADTVIIGLSKDPVTSHDKFKEKYELNFVLASDHNDQVAENYGCWVQKSMYGKTYMGIQRDTFLIDKQGKIVQLWRKVKVEGHAQEVLEAAKKLK